MSVDTSAAEVRHLARMIAGDAAACRAAGQIAASHRDNGAAAFADQQAERLDRAAATLLALLGQKEAGR